MSVTFEDSKDLPIGRHKVQLSSCEVAEPTEENLKKWPDMKPAYCFKFEAKEGEYEGHSAIRFCNKNGSKLSSLYQFVTGLNGGKEPAGFEPTDYVGKWFDVDVRKKQNSDKLHAFAAIPCGAPVSEASVSGDSPF